MEISGRFHCLNHLVMHFVLQHIQTHTHTHTVATLELWGQVIQERCCCFPIHGQQTRSTAAPRLLTGEKYSIEADLCPDQGVWLKEQERLYSVSPGLKVRTSMSCTLESSSSKEDFVFPYLKDVIYWTNAFFGGLKPSMYVGVSSLEEVKPGASSLGATTHSP